MDGRTRKIILAMFGEVPGLDDLPEENPPDPVPASGIVCKRCHNTGYITLKVGGAYTKSPCPDCFTRRQVYYQLKHSGVNPRDYARYTFDSFDTRRSPSAAKMKEIAMAWVENYKPNGPGFGVFGRSGTGKTHICIAACQALTKKYHVPHYYFSYISEMPKLIKARASYREDYDGMVRRWKECQNLYIDDLFKLAGRGAKHSLAYADSEELGIALDIIGTRYLNHLTTIFSSEYSIRDITNADEAIGSRIYEMIKPYGVYSTGDNQRFRRKEK